MGPHALLFREKEAEFDIADPGNGKKIFPDRNRGVLHLVSAGAETRLLPDPVKAGLEFVLTALTVGGNIVITADSPVNQAGNTILTFGAVQDTCKLTAIKDGTGATFRWWISANDGVALS
jgi:hypothetical protein